jgi:hypothetical protein
MQEFDFGVGNIQDELWIELRQISLNPNAPVGEPLFIHATL